MVNSVQTSPYYSYLGQIQGVKVVPPSSQPATTPAVPVATPTTPAANSTGSQQSISSLLGSGASGGFEPAVLSLLQQNSNGSFDPVSSLLGGTSTNNALTTLYANLFASSVSSSFTQAFANGSQTAKGTNNPNQSPVQNLINATTKAAVAYNQTNLQNSQTVVKANSYQADGVTPLVV